jgi:RNA polymerase sigma-70 factor (ECF subfamily)
MDAAEVSVLLMKHRIPLLGFVLAAVRNHHDAEDIWQETCLVACRKAETFAEGTNFVGWVRTIAMNTVRAHWRKAGRSVSVDDDVLDALAGAAAQAGDNAEAHDRMQALSRCLEKLNDRQRALLESRYRDEVDVEGIASRLGKAVDAVYKALLRLRVKLRECIARSLAKA